MVVMYTCALCRQKFESLRSDEDAMVEFYQLFAEDADLPRTRVCDTCWNKRWRCRRCDFRGTVPEFAQHHHETNQ